MPVGDQFKKRRNLVQKSAAPAMRNAMNYYPGHPDYVPPRPPTYQERYRMANGQNPGNANFIYGVDDRDENGNPMKDGGWLEYTQNQPRSFNPQNQDVLARASRALDSIKQDRVNPVYGGQQGYTAPGANGSGISGTSPIPGLVGRGLEVASQGLNFAQDNVEQYYRDRSGVPQVPGSQQVGYAAPGLNTQIQGSPGLRGFIDSVGQGLRSAYDSVTSALKSSPENPIRSGYVPDDRGPIPRSVASQSPNYYQQQAAGTDEEAIRRRNLAGKIDALRQRSQQDNPTVPPLPASNPMQDEIDRGTRQGNILFEPGATSSTGATKNFRKIPTEDLNGVTAPTVAGYNGNVEYVTNPFRATDERKIASSEANARRIVGGGAAADPTNMRGRFGGEYGAGLNADAVAIAEGRAVRTADGNVVYHTGTQESARRAQTAGKAEREALRDRNNLNVPQAELNRRAAADAQKAARAAKHQAFKDANGGMSYRQYDRMTGGSSGNNALTMKAVREGRLSPEEANYRMQIRAEKALRRSGNPIAAGTSQAGVLFPDQTAVRGSKPNQAGPNPLSAASEKFRPNGIVTPDSSQAARDTIKVMAEGGTAPDGTKVPPSPMFAGLAESPDNVQGVHFGIQQMVQEGKDLGAEDLRSLHAAMVAMQAGYGTSSYDPFDMTYGAEAEGLFGSVDTEHTKVFGPMYKQLVDMKAPTDEVLLGWWQSFKGNIRPDTNRFVGGSSIFSGEGAPTVSPGGYEYPLRPKKDEPFLRNPMK